MTRFPWTFCETIEPTYRDLIHLAQVINFHKRRMWSIMGEPYGNGYDDDSAHEAMDQHIENIETLHDEYSWMLAKLGLSERVA